MSITLTDIHQPVRMEDFDAELDTFNDSLGSYGYSATVTFTKWGEPLMEVTLPTGATTEFIDDLDGFLAYRIATEQIIHNIEGVLK